MTGARAQLLSGSLRCGKLTNIRRLDSSLKYDVEIHFSAEAEETFPQNPHLYLLPFFTGKEFYFHVVYRLYGSADPWRG